MCVLVPDHRPQLLKRRQPTSPTQHLTTVATVKLEVSFNIVAKVILQNCLLQFSVVTANVQIFVTQQSFGSVGVTFLATFDSDCTWSPARGYAHRRFPNQYVFYQLRTVDRIVLYEVQRFGFNYHSDHKICYATFSTTFDG